MSSSELDHHQAYSKSAKVRSAARVIPRYAKSPTSFPVAL